MKLRLSSSIFLLALTSAVLVSGSAGAAVPGKFYVGVFGGTNSSNKFKAAQYGTAFFTEASGGPLSVNAFGHLNSRSAPFFGVQLGYQAPEILLNASPQWTLGPAAELEGYYMNESSFKGILTNNTPRLPEHDFMVSYPMKRAVFLANGIISFSNPSLLVRPYIGLGIGAAIVRIAGANSAQISPAEGGVNHYNTNSNDNDSTFAGQLKLGLSYDLTKYISLFADYRWLYLANTHFVFGSTTYPTHVETSPWQVKLGTQRYSLANVGVSLNW